MKKLFITNIIYEGFIFDIYLIDGKIEMFSNQVESNSQLFKELEETLHDNSGILKTNNKSLKTIVGAMIVVTSINFLGNYNTSDLDIIKSNFDTKITFDKDKFKQEYFDAIEENKNLSYDEKKIFEEQFDYVSSSYFYFDDIDFMLNTIKNIKIIYNSTEDSNMVGCFKIENNIPIITLYKNYTKETLIHEVYHALKFSKYYYDCPYLYNNRFIDKESYDLLSQTEQSKCIKYDLKGSFLEEADTSLKTTATLEVDNLYADYKEESYIYKVYEKILGKDVMEENILNSNKITIFLNKLIDLGFDYNEVSVIATRLDLYETFKQNPDPNGNRDISSLQYQLCNDLAKVYAKKYGNTDNNLLQLTTLAVINNANIDNIQKFENNYDMQEYYQNIMNGTISIKNILNSLGYECDTKFGINDIQFDYFSNSDIYVYITLDSNHLVILSIDDNDNLKFIEERSEKNPYEYKLYDDYYEFAMNTYNNERYACFFAACYSNLHISENERVLIMREFEKTTGDLDTDDFKNLLLFGNYKKIMNGLENYYFAEKFKQK